MTEKTASAIAGALVTSLLATPLDVVKTRMQVRGGHRAMLPMLAAIVHQEGITSLWRGLTPTVAMTVPASVIYFVGYESLREILPDTTGGALLSGSIARLVAVSSIAPLELFRTRLQGIPSNNSSGHFSRVLRALLLEARNKPQALYRGLAPTLWRDLPFSGIYWAGVEQLRGKNKNSTLATFAAGATSGSIAAVLTHPLDVVKTRMQVTEATFTFSTLRQIVSLEGPSALFAGCTARVCKVAPSCAVM